MPLKIVVIDPQENAEQVYKETLGNRGHRVQILPSSSDVHKVLKTSVRDEQPVQLIIVDETAIDEGTITQSALREEFANKPILFMMRNPSTDTILKLVDSDIFIFVKPITADTLREKVKLIEDQVKFREKVENQRQSTERISPYSQVSTLSLAIGNQPDNIPLAINYVLNYLELVGTSEDDLFRVKLGLTETIINAIAHGNLEMSSAEFKGGQKNFAKWDAELAKRSQDPYYKDRKVQIDLRYTAGKEIVMTLEDNGNGFDVSKVFGEEAGEVEMFASFGRGLQMVKATADSIEHNEKGNHVTIQYLLQYDEE